MDNNHPIQLSLTYQNSFHLSFTIHKSKQQCLSQDHHALVYYCCLCYGTVLQLCYWYGTYAWLLLLVRYSAVALLLARYLQVDTELQLSSLLRHIITTVRYGSSATGTVPHIITTVRYGSSATGTVPTCGYYYYGTVYSTVPQCCYWHSTVLQLRYWYGTA